MPFYLHNIHVFQNNKATTHYSHRELRMNDLMACRMWKNTYNSEQLESGDSLTVVGGEICKLLTISEFSMRVMNIATLRSTHTYTILCDLRIQLHTPTHKLKWANKRNAECSILRKSAFSLLLIAPRTPNFFGFLLFFAGAKAALSGECVVRLVRLADVAAC